MNDDASVEPTSGERLRAAREAAGLSVTDVAAKLKLSARQISAIEAQDWKALPERTFTRGFFRGYARLVGLDEKLVDSAFTPPEPLDEMHALHAGIGEVSYDNTPARSSLAKWGIPAALLLCLAAGIAWFLWNDTPMPQQASKLARPETAKTVAITEQKNAGAPAELGQSANIIDSTTISQKTLAAPENSALSGNAVSIIGTPKAAESAQTSAPLTATGPTIATTTVPSNALTAPAASATTGLATLTAVTAAAPTPSAAAPAAGIRRLNLTVKGRSWAEIRSRGEVVASETISDGKREFTARPPMSFVLGNAGNVQLSIDGKPYDFSTHIRSDVARFRIE